MGVSLPLKRKEKPEKKPERTESGGIDYSVYYMKKPEYLLYLFLAAVALFLLGYIFYRSVILSGLLALLAFKYPAIRTKELIAKRQKLLTLQFKDMLYSLSSALSSGSSVERAMETVLLDLEQQYVNPNTYIVQEVRLIVSKLSINENIETLFLDLANRSGIEDIRTFAHIFEISKRTGGNLIQIIHQTSDVITQKIDTKLEIDTMLAQKKMEQKVLTVMPILLVFMLTETTGSFMAPLFTTVAGRIVCTVGLALIAVGFLWGKKLTDIRI